MSLGARILLAALASFLGAIMFLSGQGSEKEPFFYGFGTFCLLIAGACVFRGRAALFCGTVVGLCVFISGLFYLGEELLGGPALSTSRSQPSVINAIFFLAVFGVPGAVYAYHARFGIGRAAQRWPGGKTSLHPESQVEIEFDDFTITASYPNGEKRAVRWDALTAIGIRTTDEGPYAPDVFWGLHAGGGEPAVVFPNGAQGEGELLKALQERLPGFDLKQVVNAMGSASNAFFVIWEASATPVAGSRRTG